MEFFIYLMEDIISLFSPSIKYKVKTSREIMEADRKAIVRDCERVGDNLRKVLGFEEDSLEEKINRN